MCLAVPGRVLSVSDGELPMAQVDFGGITKQICVAYLPDIAVGEYVMVHVGFAIQLMDEETALATLADFEAMGLLGGELNPSA